MNDNQYVEKVINLFKSGTATESQWKEMAFAVLAVSEYDPECAYDIDRVVDPEGREK